jgi:hypothetical protein
MRPGGCEVLVITHISNNVNVTASESLSAATGILAPSDVNRVTRDRAPCAWTCKSSDLQEPVHESMTRSRESMARSRELAPAIKGGTPHVAGPSAGLTVDKFQGAQLEIDAFAFFCTSAPRDESLRQPPPDPDPDPKRRGEKHNVNSMS